MSPNNHPTLPNSLSHHLFQSLNLRLYFLIHPVFSLHRSYVPVEPDSAVVGLCKFILEGVQLFSQLCPRPLQFIHLPCDFGLRIHRVLPWCRFLQLHLQLFVVNVQRSHRFLLIAKGKSIKDALEDCIVFLKLILHPLLFLIQLIVPHRFQVFLGEALQIYSQPN